MSTRAPADLIYADELTALDATVIYTRAAPAAAARPAGRLTVKDILPYAARTRSVYICGSASFGTDGSHAAGTESVCRSPQLA